MSKESDAELEAGPGTERLLAFSDGVFAIAITLLVLDLTVPHVHHGLLGSLKDEWPEYLSYVLSFIIVGIIWTNHHQMFTHIKRTDHVFLLVNIVFLMWVACLPFPTALLAEYLGSQSERVTVTAIYTGAFIVGAILFNFLWRYATYNQRLTGDRLDEEGIQRTTRSYNIGPVAYLVDFGLAFVSPQVSIVLFFLLAVFYALAPIPGLLPGSATQTSPRNRGDEPGKSAVLK